MAELALQNLVSYHDLISSDLTIAERPSLLDPKEMIDRLILNQENDSLVKNLNLVYKKSLFKKFSERSLLTDALRTV